ncbi:PLP-dependent transferase [Cucurbitaria berberidis CBS 394.84]|uniref:PLP-dependent transferase n=1 Tax=Cucurbitaria berberidis CBS 394.84 TaxID=1168544 RepID=A0A9P4L7R1_9PLEO|nr:PLP-dependent transferase [Cucurbitaria berberidis CBS 394.84]KAF1845286.1 PLP-dependent transferase [Cucurbitaria berberidis CBS 394.84]
MESGLSLRMQTTLEELLPAFGATAPLKQYNPTASIDLSSAQNEVLRSELVEFFKSTIEDKLTGQAFALPGPGRLDGGHLQLREALASFFNTWWNPIHVVKPEHIVLTAGASDALENVIHAVCDDGDSVLVPGPYWYGFEHILKSRANVNVILAQPPTYENYDNYLLPSLQAAYDFSDDRSRIKAVLLCNPHNPLSRCYPKKALLELMEFCQERGLHLISDEIYGLAGLNGVPTSAPNFVSALSLTEPLVPEGAVKVDPSRIHVVWSASKLFGMSGFRVGCLVSQQNPQLLTSVSLLTLSHTNNIASLCLYHLLTWSQFPTLLTLNSERLTASYRLLATFLHKWRIDFVTPTHGIFLFAKLVKNARSVEDERSFYDRLALHGVKLGQGRFYRGVEGDFGWTRIRFSVSIDVLKSALASIDSFLLQNN